MAEEIKKFEISDRLFSVFVVLIFGIIFFLIAQILLGFKGLPENYPREITVSAQGKAFVKPDIALIKLGVTTEGMKIQEIVQENSEKMNNILKEIKDLGIEEKDVQTVRYDLSPRYEYWEKGQRIFKGYTLTQEIRVKIRDFEKIGEVLEKSTKIGANLVGELQFSVDEPEKIREIARKEAIDKAKEKAGQIASQSGLKLVKLINVYENYYPIPISPAPYKEMAGIGGEFPAVPTIQPGEEEVTVTVNLVYRVR